MLFGDFVFGFVCNGVFVIINNFVFCDLLLVLLCGEELELME